MPFATSEAVSPFPLGVTLNVMILSSWIRILWNVGRWMSIKSAMRVTRSWARAEEPILQEKIKSITTSSVKGILRFALVLFRIVGFSYLFPNWTVTKEVSIISSWFPGTCAASLEASAGDPAFLIKFTNWFTSSLLPPGAETCSGKIKSKIEFFGSDELHRSSLLAKSFHVHQRRWK